MRTGWRFWQTSRGRRTHGCAGNQACADAAGALAMARRHVRHARPSVAWRAATYKSILKVNF
ncbi:MAG: hypothetical protein QM581_15870, partial [Pseudomonas sp.]